MRQASKKTEKKGKYSVFSSFYSNWRLAQVAQVAQVALTHVMEAMGICSTWQVGDSKITNCCSLGYQKVIIFHRGKQASYNKQAGKFLGESR